MNIDAMVEAKAMRDTVSDLLVKALRGPISDSAEIAALLEADAMATQALAEAVSDFHAAQEVAQ